MMNAYDEIYLDDAMRNLGEAIDYAVNICEIEINKFMKLFISSGLSDEFGKGNPKIISGMSGTELAIETLTRVGIPPFFKDNQVDYECSPEYWCGWILAYYQWKMGCSFRDIFKTLSMVDILRLYPTLHEASEEKCIDIITNMIRSRHTTSNLQLQRKKSGYSQREISEKAGVNLRTLQQYELKRKDINKAAVSTIVRLANALGCKEEEILDFV